MATVQSAIQPDDSFIQLDYSAAAKRMLARKPALFINNEWVGSTHGATMVVEDPSTGGEVGRIVDASDADVDRAVSARLGPPSMMGDGRTCPPASASASSTNWLI